MRISSLLKREIACALIALSTIPLSLFAQTAPATSVFNYPGAGVIQAGDVSESFLPQGFTPNYSDVNTAATLGVRTFIRIGNLDRLWTTPQTHWPAGYPLTPYWWKNVMVMLYDPDTTWNRATIGAAAHPSLFATSAAYTGAQYSNYAQLTYKSTLQGASNVARHYSIEPYFVDGALRQWTDQLNSPGESKIASTDLTKTKWHIPGKKLQPASQSR
jgi:hypothetical protein